MGNVIAGLFVFLIGVGLLGGGCYAYPKYRVWQQELEGEAELKRASYNRQVAVKEAEAKRDAAALLAEAEVARAHGVKQANDIIAEGLKGHDEYLRYLWITELKSPNQTIIYVPTEANMPILEAARLKASP